MNKIMAIAWALVGASNIWFWIEKTPKSYSWIRLIIAALCFVIVVVYLIKEEPKKEGNE